MKQIGVDAYRSARKAQRRRIDHLGANQPAVLSRDADCRNVGSEQRLHDPHYAGSPACSLKPKRTFAFCSACPAAPFIRLSIAEMIISVGWRTFAALATLSRTTLRRTTSRNDGDWSAISMNGSPL